MATVNIRGIPVSFPFKPYDIQKAYMEKVIECLQEETNGVLESPTGTGKTLSLLCASLAWSTLQKAKNSAERQMCGNFFSKGNDDPSEVMQHMWGAPTILYASRTHSQLSQAMQELKRTSYAHVRATIVGSRDQLCIHPDVMQQVNNATKIQMCQAMVKTRSCYLQNRVEKMTCDRNIQDMNIADIEDLVKLGQKHKFCPYYMSRELKKQADIVFLPYNYLLDPRARRANQVDLRNSVIILDEGHNVEKVCEDSASFQLKTTDVALCIDEVTQVMKHMEQGGDLGLSLGLEDAEKDFSEEDLALLKMTLLKLEETIDKISIPRGPEGITFEGKYIFEIFNCAGINDSNQARFITLLDKLIAFFGTKAKENPFQRTGAGIQIIQDLLMVVFQKVTDDFKEIINKCYKVHFLIEEEKKYNKTADTWLSKASTSKKPSCRVLNYWCFSPNFGMQMLMDQGVRCVILTSGTLAPLKPLISELGIKVGVRLENPHVVGNKQICVKILSTGPDGTPLNSGYQNRDNPKYIDSLGLTIVNVSRQIPNGLLVFFASYVLLAKCQEKWQESGIWSRMNEIKTVYVEPRTKDAFNTVMQEFYERVKNPDYKGAIFMAVCRGKVSEGLDFADINGRGVIITGLPYPPFKDPRVVLKKKYLDLCRSKDSEYVSGQEWYGLEATRAVNQAIGRVIRHRYDYGVILLLDNRFTHSNVKNQLSLWVREHVQQAKNFGEVIRDIRLFFKNATEFDVLRDKEKLSNTSICTNKENVTNTPGEVIIYEKLKPSGSNSSSPVIIIEDDPVVKRVPSQLHNAPKRRKVVLVQPEYSKENNEFNQNKSEEHEYLHMLRTTLDQSSYALFIGILKLYKKSFDLDEFIENLNNFFKPKPYLRYLIQGIVTYVKADHKEKFIKYWEAMR